MSEALLELRHVEAGYGRAALVLRGLSLTVRPREVVCLVGPNGAGKSTVLKVASGMLVPRSGEVLLAGKQISAVVLEDEDVTRESPHGLLAKGLAHVLQGHSVFPEMTVGENVRMGGYTIRDRRLLDERVEQVQEVFPIVRERWGQLAGLLSGGQQKMVEFGRALMLDPAVVLLDEPSMGLDPKTTQTVFEQVDRLRQIGKGVLLVEQNARRALQMADRGCVLDLGVVAIQGSAPELLEDPQLASLYLGGGIKPDRGSSGGPSASGGRT